jgi:apolipoprotein N-acyltransferase
MVGSVGNDPRLPFFDSNNPLLIGALAYNQDKEIFNSAFAILNSGTVLEPYHKQILMPFGEFMPMASTFPFLEKLNPNVPNFTAGTEEKVFEYPMVRGDDTFYEARVSPLICYEDVIADIARRSVEKGAQLLVNITNDGWFGDSLAPYQHDLIARFRAVENRRFLVRSTNTGFTSLIAPTGRLVDSIPPFSEGTLLAEVTLMSYITLYTGYVKDWLGWIVLIIIATSVVSRYLESGQRLRK